MNKIAIIGDLHIPFEDLTSLNKALCILKEEKPDVIVVNGDLLDCWEISRFDKVPSFSKLIKEEIALARGKKTRDKRETIKRREGDRDIRRTLKTR